MTLKAKASSYHGATAGGEQTRKVAVETSWPLLIVNDTLSVYVLQAYVYVNMDGSATVNSCCRCRPGRTRSNKRCAKRWPRFAASAAGDELLSTLPFKRFTQHRMAMRGFQGCALIDTVHRCRYDLVGNGRDLHVGAIVFAND